LRKSRPSRVAVMKEPRDLTPERTMRGPAVARFAALVDKHVAFRGEDDEG
jgi:hypothetical protein